jgi:hypothetical protein
LLIHIARYANKENKERFSVREFAVELIEKISGRIEERERESAERH